jgi:hypothetical protein
MPRIMKCSVLCLIVALISCASISVKGSLQGDSQKPAGRPADIRGDEHYAIRDGLRIYLWEKRKAALEATFATSGKVALLVHGGTWSGRPDFDLQIRDYSLRIFSRRMTTTSGP